MISISYPHKMVENKIWEILFKTKPLILGGHLEFLGLHAEGYLRMWNINQHPEYLKRICDVITACVRGSSLKPNVVLAPGSQGMYYAQDIAAKMEGVRAVYTGIEPETGRPTNEFLYGSRINPGDQVVIVNDINVTGESLRRLIELVKSKKAEVLGTCVFADMSGGRAEIKREYPFHSVINLNLPFWPENVCTQNCDGKPLVTMWQIMRSPVIPGDVAYEALLSRQNNSGGWLPWNLKI
jgi:orotate phosphoribosyltransferase